VSKHTYGTTNQTPEWGKHPPDDWQVVEDALLVSSKRDPAFLALARLREREAQLEQDRANWAESVKRLQWREDTLARAEAAEARVAELEEALRRAVQSDSSAAIKEIARRALGKYPDYKDGAWVAHKEETP